jgi:anti-sigma B factor antagonist
MFEVTVNDDTSLVLSGRLDASQVDKAKKELQELSTSTTLDCTPLDYISSAGLGILISTQKRLIKDGQTLHLTNLNPHVRNVFHYAGLDKIFGLED